MGLNLILLPPKEAVLPLLHQTDVNTYELPAYAQLSFQDEVLQTYSLQHHLKKPWGCYDCCCQ